MKVSFIIYFGHVFHTIVPQFDFLIAKVQPNGSLHVFEEFCGDALHLSDSLSRCPCHEVFGCQLIVFVRVQNVK